MIYRLDQETLRRLDSEHRIAIANVRSAIEVYERQADCGRAQSDDAWAAFLKLKSGLSYLGIDHNANNMALLGSKRYKLAGSII